MLNPANRLTFVDAIRPPPTFRLESAMAVTFTLDLKALLAAPAAMTLTETSSSITDEGRYEPVELLHALRSEANKLTVFNQVGEIALPPSRRVFAFLERVVVPVAAPLGGIVHPKVWVLRYEASGVRAENYLREKRLRVLVASRNLTFDMSWDTVIRLDETIDSEGVVLEPVAELFEGLLENVVGEVSNGHRERVRSLSASVKKARFALPLGVEDLRVHIIGMNHAHSPLPSAVERSLIISPFVNDEFFSEVRPEKVTELISRSESLDLLQSTTLDEVERVYFFDDGSSPELDLERGDTSQTDPGQPLVGLHAKVFAFEEGDKARVFVGSANATDAAFSRNVEILVEMEGNVSTLGIDRLYEGTADERGFQDLLRPYYADQVGSDEDGDRSLDHARHKIARLICNGVVNRNGSNWTVTYRTVDPIPILAGIEIYCWPLAVSGNRKRVMQGERLNARFENSLETISGFLAFELVDEEGTQTRFVIPVMLVGLPENRESFLLRTLIGSAERFLRYVLAVLHDDWNQSDLADSVESICKDEQHVGNGSLNLPVLENILKTMRRNPSKLAGLHPLVSDLADDDALPPGFAELWELIYDVSIAEFLHQ